MKHTKRSVRTLLRCPRLSTVSGPWAGRGDASVLTAFAWSRPTNSAGFLDAPLPYLHAPFASAIGVPVCQPHAGFHGSSTSPGPCSFNCQTAVAWRLHDLHSPQGLRAALLRRLREVRALPSHHQVILSKPNPFSQCRTAGRSMEANGM